MNQDKTDALETGWVILLGVLLTAMIAIGGLTSPPQILVLIQTALAWIILVPAFYRLRSGVHSRMILPVLIVVLAAALPLIQLVPLPHGVWQLLPAREFVRQALAVDGASGPHQVVTLSPIATKNAALSLLPGLAVFIATLTVRARHLPVLALVIVCAALANAMLGLAQRAAGVDSALYIYGSLNRAFALGTFGNRNFFGTQLFTAIPFVFGLLAYAVVKKRVHMFLGLLLLFCCMAIYVATLGAIASRAGIMLAMVSSVMSAFLLKPIWLGRVATGRGFNWGLFGLLAFLLFVAAQGSMAWLLRLANTDLTNDLRWMINQETLRLIMSYMPFGSGFGSFVPLFQMAETPELTGDRIINQAHNDYFQILLEGGLPAAILLCLFLAWYVRRVFGNLSGSHDAVNVVFQKAAGISVLLVLLQSFVDYPLRNAAMLSLFALYCGILAQIPGETKRSSSRSREMSPQMPVVAEGRRPELRVSNPFQRAKSLSTSNIAQQNSQSSTTQIAEDDSAQDPKSHPGAKT